MMTYLAIVATMAFMASIAACAMVVGLLVGKKLIVVRDMRPAEQQSQIQARTERSTGDEQALGQQRRVDAFNSRERKRFRRTAQAGARQHGSFGNMEAIMARAEAEARGDTDGRKDGPITNATEAGDDRPSDETG